MDRLDAGAIALPGVEVRVLERCGSTNMLIEERLARPVLLAAEAQTAGRGRRGRRWHSPAGAGITFSLGVRVARPARELAGLSLAAGVAVARALRSLGAPVSLKWPNDLLIAEAKLGGILVETRDSFAVIGIGLNNHRVESLEEKLGRPVAFLEAPDRNLVIRRIAERLLEALHAFEQLGLEAVRADWTALDAHAGRRVRVRLADGRQLTGIAEGLAEDGALRLATRRGMRAVRSGTVLSARPA
ncbi:MAG TPA: biotin--[acetyl-CoA-carboxylase] ligase [Burkholderiales bacterium]|nr:biotin--[acetyl-CoA-carboxylase] ligase [Burkholderiales bacterium]